MDNATGSGSTENKYAIVLFDFSPSVKEELELNTGDFLLVTETIDDFWVSGKRLHDDKKGQFPKEFIKFVQLPTKKESDVFYFALDTFYPETTDDLHFKKGDIVVCERVIEGSWGCGYCGINHGMFPLNYVKKIPQLKSKQSTNFVNQNFIGLGRAVLSLKAQLDEELTFEVGDEIGITDELPDGWYKGILGGNTGIFPAAFVELIQPISKSKQTQNNGSNHTQPTSESNNTGLKSASILEVSDGDLKTTPLQVSLSGHNRSASNNNIKSDQPASIYQFASECAPSAKETLESDDDLSSKLQNPAIFKVYSLHNFLGGSPTELSFGQGETIDILEEADEHWFVGRLGIRVGFVPRSYVSRTNPNHKNMNNIPRHASFNQPKPNHQQSPSKKLIHSQSESNIKLYVQNSSKIAENKIPSNNSSSWQSGNSEAHETAEVRFNYVSQGGKDLTIHIGDKLMVLQKYDDEWTEVCDKNGVKGIVPTNYIKIWGDNKKLETKEIDTVSKSAVSMNKNDLIIPTSNNSMPKEKSFDGNPNTILNHVEPKLKNFYSSEPFQSQPATNRNLHRQNFISPKPFQSQVRVHKSIVPGHRVVPNEIKNQHNNNNNVLNAMEIPSSFIGNISTDDASNYRKQQHINIREKRSKSYVNTEVIDKHLLVWQSMYSTSPEKSRELTTLCEQTDNVYEAPMEKPRKRTNLRRSASMKEHRTRPRIIPNNRTQTPQSLHKIKSNSNIKNNEFATQETTELVSSKNTVSSTVSLPGKFAPSSAVSRVRGSVSTSTGSSESLNSLSESRNSQSTTYSDSNTSGKDSGYQHQPQPAKVPPPLPTRRGTSISSSPISPPPPRRKESLQNKTYLANQPTPPPSINQPIISSIPPSRPAPERPKPITVHKPGTKPPMRPSNPPRNAVTANRGSIKSLHKMKMERLRNDIEEYSRMKSDLESLYHGTTDGRERREISENLGFVKTNLKRLQMEFHNLINDSDHIYESIEIQKQEQHESSSNSLEVPAVTEVPSSPASIRKKKIEKRVHVAKELLSTEKDFLMDVTIIVEDIMRPLSDLQLPIDIPILFGNILEIKEFSQSMTKSLEHALEIEQNITEDSSDDSRVDEMTGSAFINHIPRMEEVYKVYCRSHDDAISALEKYELNNDIMVPVNDLLEKLKAKTNVFDLGSFLIKPVQRILKYPLLLHELLKASEYPTEDGKGSTKHPDYHNIMKALALVGDVANKINEEKRRKDLVRKYRKVSHDGLSEKIGRMSLKSGKKKINRISRKLGRATGISISGERDEKFEEIVKRFKIIERAVKGFHRDIKIYCDRCHATLTAELATACHLIDFVDTKDRGHYVASFHTALDSMAGTLYKYFERQVDSQVLTPISTLISRFDGPQTIIDKRMDKLIDYDTCQKNSDSKEKIMAAKHDYEALHASLLDELPKLCDLSVQLLSSCVGLFMKLHRFFHMKLVNELSHTIKRLNNDEANEGKVQLMDNPAVVEKFDALHKEAMRKITSYQFMPGSYAALMSGVQSTLEGKQRTRSASSPNVPVDELSAHEPHATVLKNKLLKKYTVEQLYVVTQTVGATQLMDIPCKVNDIVAVKKQQDPMGNSERWFVDNGEETGFISSSYLRPYNAQSDNQSLEGNLIDIGSPPPDYSSPVPAPRARISPGTSVKSTDSSGSFHKPNSPTATMSAYSFRQTLSRTSSSHSSCDLHPSTNPSLLEVMQQEDELLDDEEILPTKSASTNHCRAEFDFIGRNNLELSVHKGDIVTVIMHHDIDNNPEWWFCSAHGAQGYVPSSYLSKMEYI